MSTPVRCRFDELGPTGPQATELCDLREVIEAWSLDEVPNALARVEAATRSGSVAAGFVTYEAAPAFDRALLVRASPAGRGNLPLAWFGVFATSRPAAALADARRLDDDRVEDLPVGGGWTCDIGQDAHRSRVDALHAAIAAGDTYLTNLTSRFRRPWAEGEDPFALYAQLASQYASGLHAYLETDDWVVVSGSPELFFDLAGHRLTVQPMKGTARRGRWAEEDRAIAEALRQSPKERAENVMVVDLVRNDLGRIAVPGTVEVPELCEVERHPSVWQLSSTVAATVRPDVGLADVFGALFPCASVTGAPKVSTMRLIAELESSPRGVYCGAIGRVSRRDGAGGGLEARFSVAIRTAVIDKVGRSAVYGSGGGITADSIPEDEWHELLLKAGVLAEAATGPDPDAALLETMHFDPADRVGAESGIRNLDRHLHRLAQTARHLDRPCPADLRRRVVDSVAHLGPARIRLLVHPDGGLVIEDHRLPVATTGSPIRLCIDHVAVDPADLGLFHKTTDRRRYVERSERHPSADDVVLVNLRDEVTETTRANLAVRIDGTWCTPPLGSGLLPGVERGRLVEEGRLLERTITIEELSAADEIATVSSLRGWNVAIVEPCPRCATGS